MPTGAIFGYPDENIDLNVETMVNVRWTQKEVAGFNFTFLLDCIVLLHGNNCRLNIFDVRQLLINCTETSLNSSLILNLSQLIYSL